MEDNLLERGKVQDKLQYWMAHLRDMGRRNRLLFFKDTRASSIIISEPNALEIFDSLVVNGRSIYAPLSQNARKSLFDESESDDEGDATEYEKRDDEFLSNKTLENVNQVLSNLRYKARTVREEQGFNALYMGFGLLKWQEGTGSEFSEAPLVLVPIDIGREGLGARFSIELLEEEIVINPTLQTKLLKDFKIELKEIENGLTAETLTDYWKQVEQLVQNYEGWEVLSKVVIGIFNFQTLMLIKDLERNEEHYIRHPLIQMLSGRLDNLMNETGDVLNARDLDEKVSPLNVFQILDADSSQQEAIEAAKSGVSFVLQGPPGTGKSQTIANIIAESMAIGKKILFVSQKSVALDVVHNRLSQHGLGEFCLEIHSYKKNKKDVIQDLGKSLSARKGEAVQNSTQKKNELSRLRRELNDFVKELHTPRFGMKLSLFRVLGELGKVYESPNIKFSLGNIKTINTEQYQKHLSLIREIASYDLLISDFGDHPWKGFNRGSSTIQEREEISEKFEKIARILSSQIAATQDIAKGINIESPEKLRQHFDILRIVTVFKPLIFGDEFIDLTDRFLEKYDSIIRFLKPQYWKDISLLTKINWREEKLHLDKISRILMVLRKTREAALSNNLLPNGDYDLSLEVVNKLKNNHKEIIRLYKFAVSLFADDDQPEILQARFDVDAEGLVEWFSKLSTQTDQIIEWVNFRNIVQQGKDIGIGDFVNKALEKGIPANQWENAYKRRFYVLLSDLITQSHSALSKFRSSAHSNAIDRFRQLDNELREIASLEIREKLYKIRPEATWVQADSAETIILRKELNKQRRIKPLRRLFSEIPNLILNLKPCLMMSPLTVSQLLDPEIYKFDIAIFDEASQIPPEYAVGTIVRAKQVVIAGDRHQMPPTRFFHAIDTDEYDEDDYDVEDYESILNACDAISMPNKMLLWHYRSADESLIAFSNYNFYDNKLLTFPNSNGEDKSTGLEFVHVPDGIYRRGKGARNNQIEARKVAELVFETLVHSPKLSIGVVAFSQSQRQIIEQEIDRLKREKPNLYALFDYNKEEQVFVKSLETVQGDERDVIIFSIGYGKDEIGKMSMNFGPLNRQGGERRLNVAVTRARRAVKLVASIEPEDIDLSRTQSLGAKLLKSYMKVARDGMKEVYADETLNPNAEFDSPFEEAVYDSLSRRGIILKPQVGVSQYRIDFGVVDPDQRGRYLLGIECDGATYHSSPTARDRDRLRQQILENKFGWRIHRIWSRDWIDNPHAEIKKVIDAINVSKKSSPRKSVKKN
ncbi:DNA helicase related protein [hydrothermal vent metagenome]|uniref:DNA helicase related protein n=1 Tax=hydrothermal vent metagenome TaxID=652676 RepID=A0A3B0UQ51_9ZZZZ